MRAIREGDFKLYVDALTKIVPWFFSLDHTNFTRWIPAHLRDMVTLKDVHPKVFAEFLKGNFSFTGCDTVSFFGGRGKRTAWDTWKAYDHVTPALCSLATTPESVESFI